MTEDLLPGIVLRQQQLGMSSVRGALEVTTQTALFRGHFPGRPVLPGVALLGLVQKLCGRAWGGASELAAVELAKFLAPVTPGSSLQLVVEREGARVRFTARSGEAELASGRVTLRQSGVTASHGNLAVGVDPEQSTGAFPPIATLVPHRPPLCLLDRVLVHRPGAVTCRGRIKSDNPLLGEPGLPGWALPEYLAQTAAVLRGLGGAVRGGSLAAVRDATLPAGYLPAGTELELEVVRDGPVRRGLARLSGQARVAGAADLLGGAVLVVQEAAGGLAGQD